MMKKNLHFFVLFTAISCCITACQQRKGVKNVVNNYDQFLDQFIDTTVSPGFDFFKFANGKWIKNNPIPAAEKTWGIWSLVNEENYDRLKTINTEAANAKSKPGSNAQKIGDFWTTAMDTLAIEKVGLQPLQFELDKINTVKNVQDVVGLCGYLHSIGVGVLFANAIFQDEMRSDQYAMHFYQGGIGLPDRDYYFDTDTRTQTIRNEYAQHISNMFQLMGESAEVATLNSETIMRLETQLAAASRKLEDLRDPYANYKKMAISDFSKTTITINWANFLTNSGIQNVDSVIIGQPEFFLQLAQLLNSETIEHWKVYMRWHLINTFAPQLSNEFDQENFNFYGQIVGGAKEQRVRWKRILEQEDQLIGFMLGEVYVQKYYSAATKLRYEQLTDHILLATQDRIQQLEWMSDSTKQKALVKLNAVTKKVGYPEVWRDYSSLTIDRNSYLRNVINCNQWLSDFYISKLYKPIDRTEWEMTPQTYNAYYNPSNNEIVLPAAIFIIPNLPDSMADDALIYGYAGASTIGHEIIHAFDDQGSQFDAEGNLKNWWTVSDKEQFLLRTKGIISQFNQFVVLDSLHVNGEATQGENIADLGGVIIGLEAFKKTEQYKNGQLIGGYTPVQRYFLGYALGWMGHYRDQSLALRIKTDVHAPNFLRVNGPFVNVPEFYEAFSVQPNQKMYVADSLRVKIW